MFLVQVVRFIFLRPGVGQDACAAGQLAFKVRVDYLTDL